MRNRVYSCDFETTTDENDCRVWAFGAMPLDANTFFYGKSIEEFFSWAFEGRGKILFFHNLRFDGQFIIYHLMKNGCKFTLNREPKENEFTALISDMGVYYSLKIAYVSNEKLYYLYIYDSLKLFPGFSIDKIAKTFKLEAQKEEIDYTAHREVGHELSKQEISYLYNDVKILKLALNSFVNDYGMNKKTIGGNALESYKTIIGPKKFKYWFPPVQYDDEIREAYRGGYTYVNPKYRGRVVGEGLVFDVNSLYPSCMYNCVLPYGEGVFFEGRYIYNEEYPLYIQMLKCRFRIREGKLPMVQVKLGFYKYATNEYITNAMDEEVVLKLTSVDLKLFLENYETFDIEWLGGYMYWGSDNLFKKYIDKWIDIKIRADQDGNPGLRTLAKLMLNNLYGKFAVNPKKGRKIINFVEDMVKYSDIDEEGDGLYIPVACFITAYAREKTIRAAQNLGDRFVYCDTDSLHIIGTEIPDDLDIDPYRLGAWKMESHFMKAKFLRAKSYIEYIVTKPKFKTQTLKNKYKLKTGKGKYVPTKMKITCAGMPDKLKSQVTFNNFGYGSIYVGKLVPKLCKGGVVLIERDFTIKP